MTLEAIQRDHLKTQRKIDTKARDRHFQSQGKWEGEKTLAETIQEIEDRLFAIEERIKKHDNR